jgi:hypothetical protein
MEPIRKAAARRGLRAAAQVAALTGIIAAGAGMSRADQAKPITTARGAEASDGASAPDHEGTSTADQVARLVQVRRGDNCRNPMWGPPAPPPMRPSLLDFAGEPTRAAAGEAA